MDSVKQLQSNFQSSLPVDIALKIVSSLRVLEVCALGSCSRFWRELCESDCVWESLARQRWPSVAFLNESSSSSEPIVKGWRKIYIRKHKQMACRATSLIEFVDKCSSSGSIEFTDCNKAIEKLVSMELSFRDVQVFLFKPKLSVLLNLIGLHYCIFSLKVPAKDAMDAVRCSNISEREVSVRWWKLGRWFYGFRMRDEHHSHLLSLADLLTEKGEVVLGVLHRGAIHEVLRVEISSSNNTSIHFHG